jgi:hypothetical protein
MAKERGFQYRERSYDDAKKRRDSGGGNFDSYVKKQYKMYKVKDGKNLVRILPPTFEPPEGEPDHYGLPIWVNYSIGPDNSSYLSLAKMLHKPDPLDEARREADREGDEDTAKELAARQRVLIWVIDRENEDDGPMVWACPQTVDKDILSISTDDDTKEVVAIDSPKKGQDLRFYKEGKGLSTKYPAAKMRLMNPGPLNEDDEKQQEWLDFITENPLPDVLQYYDYDHISTVFNGHAKSKDDEDERPTKKALEPKDDDDEPKARPRPHVKEAAEAEDDEPEERPKPKSTKSRKSDDDDEDLSIAEQIKKRRAAKEADDDE